MTTYQFSQISDFEFESLCRDLLQAELGLPLELFAPGPDRGIDVRYIGAVNGEQRTIVAQCKRWAEDSFSKLLRHLTQVEVAKIRKLAPERYILMTSVPLSPARKDKIVAAVQPWIRTPADVFGPDDISGLLARHEEVERRHIKLWLTSTEVLDALLNSGIATRGEGAIERAQRQLQLWVPNPSFERAREILEATRVCVISGAPGIGKTMLADVLLASYTSGGFEPVVISADIDEGEQTWRSGRQQVFYYDDFLGHVTYGELQLHKNEASRLAHFIEGVRNKKGKRFILTTREYILSEALHRYERLSDVQFGNYKSIVSLADYTPLVRAQILYNHLFFSDLPQSAKKALVPGRRYWDVIKHRNYNPRVIEHAVSLPGVADLGTEGFVSNMIATLDDPARVWGRIFDNLPPTARRILLAVASLPSTVLLEDLRVAVQSLAGADFDSGEFRNAIEVVEGTFLELKEAIPGQGKPERIVTIRDPSVLDYLWGRLEAVGGEADFLLDRATFFEQCVVLYQGHSHATAVSRGLADQAMRGVDHETVASRALDLIASSNPQLTRVTGAGGDYFRRDSASPEHRAAFLVSVLAEHQESHKIAAATASALEAARTEWAAGRGLSSSGVYLLEQVKNVETLLPADALMRTEQALLSRISGQFEQTEDFTALVNLADLSPSLFAPPHRHLESWGGEFRDFLSDMRGWLLEELDDPDWIESELRVIGNVAAALGVDVTELVAVAEERIDELRYENEDFRPDDDWRESFSAARSETNEAKVDALFRSLL